MSEYQCREGCYWKDPGSMCERCEIEYGVAKEYADEPVLKGGGSLYLEIYDPFVDHPEIVHQRHVQEIVAKNERCWQRARAEGYRRLQAQDEQSTQRSNDLQFCPVLPPPLAY